MFYAERNIDSKWRKVSAGIRTKYNMLYCVSISHLGLMLLVIFIIADMRGNIKRLIMKCASHIKLQWNTTNQWKRS